MPKGINPAWRCQRQIREMASFVHVVHRMQGAKNAHDELVERIAAINAKLPDCTAVHNMIYWKSK
jgi:hypothetical protein